MHKEVRVLLQVRFDSCFKDGSAGVIQTSERHQVDSLKHIRLGYCLGASNYCIGRNLPEIIWLTSCNIELDTSYLEVAILFKDPSAKLEKGHEQLLLNHTKFHILGLGIDEIFYHRIFIAE